MGKKELPHCNELFTTYWDPWYGDDDRKHKGISGTRPDMESDPEWKGLSAEEMCNLTKEGQEKVLQQVQTMAQAAESDFRNYLDVQPPIDIEWVDAFDKHFTEERVIELLDRSNPKEYSNEYVVTCIEFGAVLGTVLRNLCSDLEWLPNWPYWESSIWDKRSGTEIPIFHWAIKKMSSYGVDDGFKPKVLWAVQLLEESAKK